MYFRSRKPFFRLSLVQINNVCLLISICETEEGTEVELILDPFVYRYDFKVTGTIAGTEVSFTRADVDKVWIKDMDQFVAYEENGVHYRMYEPECMGKRPLVLFLHGGGECGEDNELQLTGTLQCCRAMRYALSFCYHRESIFLSSLISAWFSSNTSLYWRPPK